MKIIDDMRRFGNTDIAVFLRPLAFFFLRRLSLPLFIFCWPALYLFNHLFPINGYYTAIGNDFYPIYYKYKVYLLDCLSNFSFPLWSPAEGAGFPFFSNPFTQSFYPLNIPLVGWYKISGGFTTLNYTFFTILGLSIFSLGLYKWLRLINSNLRAVIFSTLVMAVSFKMTEILRFPNAVHCAAWYPWILYALGMIFLSPSLRNRLFSGLLLIFSVICFCTAGYPYYIYYSLFLFIPYLLIFFITPLRVRFFGARSIVWKQVLPTLVTAGILSVSVCGPYLLSVKNLMAQTTDRTGKNFTYSTAHVFNYMDTIGSLTFPPAAQAEGWYFFSITALLIILLHLFRLHLAPSCIQKPLLPPVLNDKWIKLFFITWIAVISYISYGRFSHLFIFLWKYMPGFSALRVWGRFNIILVPIIAWLLSIAYASLEAAISHHVELKKRPRAWGTILTLSIIYVILLLVQIYLYQNKIYDFYWRKYFTGTISSMDIVFIITGIIAFIVILLSVLFLNRTSCKSDLCRIVMLIALVQVATVEMWPVGAHTWASLKNAFQKRDNLDVARTNELSFRHPRNASKMYDTIPLEPKFSVGIIPNWYFGRYTSFLKAHKDQENALKILMGVQDGTRIFFAESINHPSIASFLKDAVRYRNTDRLVSYTGDELVLETNTPVHGYLTFVDNWDPYWHVYVNGQEKKLEKLFGTFKSVYLTKGPQRVEFRYEPTLRKILFGTKIKSDLE